LAEKAASDRSIVKTLRNGLKDDDRRVLLACVALLGALGENGTSAIPDLLRIIRKQKDDLSFEAAGSLAQMGKKGSAALIEMSKDRDDFVRAVAVCKLKDCHSQDGAVEAILEAFHDPVEDVSGAGAGLLEEHEIKPATATWKKFEAGLQHRHPQVRIYSALCLLAVKSNHKAAIQIALAGMTEKHPLVRRIAAEALECTEGKGGTAMIKALAAALKDVDSDVRMAAAMALYKAEDRAKGAIAALTEALEDPDEGVRDWAGATLKQMGL
jgi:HEAT repeat protein